MYISSNNTGKTSKTPCKITNKVISKFLSTMYTGGPSEVWKWWNELPLTKFLLLHMFYGPFLWPCVKYGKIRHVAKFLTKKKKERKILLLRHAHDWRYIRIPILTEMMRETRKKSFCRMFRNVLCSSARWSTLSLRSCLYSQYSPSYWPWLGKTGTRARRLLASITKSASGWRNWGKPLSPVWPEILANVIYCVQYCQQGPLVLCGMMTLRMD
jgi:hypothetical protein